MTDEKNDYRCIYSLASDKLIGKKINELLLGDVEEAEKECIIIECVRRSYNDYLLRMEEDNY